MTGTPSSGMKYANKGQTADSEMACPQNARSRICVKNLPRYVSEDRLREFFSLKGEITDIKLMHTKTEQEAVEAIKYFNKSFMDTCRITCEVARKVGDPEIPRPWSRYSLKKHQILSEEEKTLIGSKGSRGANANANGENYKCKKDDEYNDPKFQEFLQVMQPRSKSKLWANDAPAASFFEIGKGASNKKCYLLESKHAYLKDTLKEDVSEQNAEDGSTEECSNKIFVSIAPSSTKDKKEEILKTGHLMIFNLPYVATEEEVEKHFSIFGDISDVHLLVDKDTKRSKGTAYLVYVLPESAARAFEKLNKSSFQGRILEIRPAEENLFVTSNFTQQPSKTFKQLRNEERKASESRGDTRGWNRLLMRTDTIAENIARKFGVSKSEVLDREANDPAVRIALGETEVIAETLKALSSAGINVASLELTPGKTNVSKRSRVILVKNLPYCSSKSELADMFGKFGNLDKVILPSTKTLALVIFVEPADAYACFNGLRYKCYKGGPLYLELLPEDILSQTPILEGDSNNNVIEVEHDSNRVLLEGQLEAITDLDVDPDRIESRSLYVKNLNFKTSDEELKRHFTGHMKEGRILSVMIKKHLKNGENVSMGFGFIEFDSVDTAVRICRDLQGTNLDGHALKLQLCKAKKDVHQCEKVKSSTKLIVRNVAFEATEKDLRELFSPFGQVKSLRLPKRYGNHRGFAFVEYVTKQEAKNALGHLSSTHLYGRRLVLETAKEGESLEELRARTATHFTDSIKLSKKMKHATELDKGND
ncbi:hypothetical protein DH2020_025796 [Rehmannia glutinosa]|uniref:RRM domain-containing protein n=1 Tax=Rehmannia glutinosa TaxID=99300 RepID=A0ABR0W165_REHGL